MGNTPRSNGTNAKRWKTTQDKLTKEILEHKATKKELQDAQDIIAALTQENLELGKQVKDYRDRFIKGGVSYTINNGYVSSATYIEPISEWTYLQPIHDAIGTRLYKTFPFIKVVDRQLTIDETQYKKYKGALI